MKPQTIKFILVFFNIVMLSSLGWSQCDGCNPGISEYFSLDSNSYVNCTEWVTNIDDCYQGDLDVLQEFIDLSQFEYSPLPYDLEPINLFDQ